MDTAQGHLSRPMPDALPIFNASRRLSRRFAGLRAIGTSTRRLLRRLLLGSDGTFVCRRGDERPLDRSPRAARPFGETYSIWTVGSPRRRCRLYRHGRLDAVIFEAVISYLLGGATLLCAAERWVVAPNGRGTAEFEFPLTDLKLKTLLP